MNKHTYAHGKKTYYEWMFFFLKPDLTFLK